MKLTTLFFVLTVGICNGAKILVYNPHLSHSHYVFQAHIADVLQEAGHNVTVVIPEYDAAKNTYIRKARVLIRSPPAKTEKSSVFSTIQDEMWDAWDPMTMRKMSIGMSDSMSNECARLYADEAFVQFLRDQEFEFAILESIQACGYGLLRKLGIKAYAVTSPLPIAEQTFNIYGLPGRWVNPRVVTDYHPDMTFMERLHNYILPHLYTLVQMTSGHKGFQKIQELMEPDFNIHEAMAQARFYFVNTDEHMDFPRPISHKFVYIGGVTLDNKIGELNDDYRSIFETSRQGVVVVTFGSLALSSQMPADRRNALLAMFRAFPDISFIWKYEVEDNVASDLPNVYKRKWIPQKELLAHPKLLAIVSHGGMNSVLETCFAGKPMLAIPLFYDQSRNAKMLDFRKTAVIVDKHKMTAETLIGALGKLTQGSTGEAYRHRASAIASMIAAKPLSGKERFIKYVNFAVQFKDEEDVLDIGHRKHGFIKYYNLDLYALFALIGLVVVLGSGYLILTIYRLIVFSILSVVSKQKVQ